MSEAATVRPLPTDPPVQRGTIPALLWACYLGSSWTWVIGMFFPTLFFAHWGWLGWLVFAAPNVIGAAAMGFVLRDAEASRRIVAAHGPACRAFTYVTLGFHAMVAVWVLGFLFTPIGIAAAAAAAVSATYRSRRGQALILAAIVTAVSFACFAYAATLPEAWPAPGGLRQSPLSLPALAWFLPASITGFALCPYLDLTFHRARRATGPGTGKAAFALGFGGVFLTMIVFSVAYAGVLNPLAWSSSGQSPLPNQAWALLLGAHFILQIGFTFGIHTDEASRDHPRGWRGSALPLALALLAGGVLGACALLDQDDHALGPALGELLYRSFLLFYGLVFPAYVWLCVIPTRRPVPARRKLTVFTLATLIALPMGFAGFVNANGPWVAAALAVVVLSRGITEALAPRAS